MDNLILYEVSYCLYGLNLFGTSFIIERWVHGGYIMTLHISGNNYMMDTDYIITLHIK